MSKRPPSLNEAWRDNPDLHEYRQALSEEADARAETASLLPDPAQDEPECAVCGNLGYVRLANVPVGHRLFGKLVRCPNPDCVVARQQEEARYQELAQNAMIPPEYADATFDLWHETARDKSRIANKRLAYYTALAFCSAADSGFEVSLSDVVRRNGLKIDNVESRPCNSIIFAGPNGVGKTSMAIAIQRELLRLGVAVIYLRFADLFAELRKAMAPNAVRRPDDVLDDYVDTPVMILDELPRSVTDWQKDRVEQLINHRYTHRLPTVITTNLAHDAIETVYDLTITHRLLAMAHWIPVGGVVLRRLSPNLNAY